MKRAAVPRLGLVAALVLGLAAAPARAASVEGPAAGSARGTVLERLTDVGSAIRLGFGVAPLHGPIAPAPTAIPRVQDPESGTVVSFDLSLAWPGAAGTPSALQPYVVLGPALFVVEPDDAGRLLGTRVDPTVQLGARAGAGLSWRLGRHATLFGAYEVTTTPGEALPLGSRGPADGGAGGYDFTYGLRFRY